MTRQRRCAAVKLGCSFLGRPRGRPVGVRLLGTWRALLGRRAAVQAQQLGSAVAAGGKKLKLACVVVYTPTKTATAPCGACRQVIYEFGPEARVISVCAGREEIDVSIGALLPGAFGPADLA